jgi:5'-nucleotidase
MRILVSNDDGVMAPGIRALAKAMTSLGEVFVVAPDRQRSASSHGISLHHPLYAETVDLGIDGVHAVSVNGTPVDCVKWGIYYFGSDEPFDMMVSGINEGPNLATDVLYSGTVAAAGEASLQRMPSIAFSLIGPPYDYEPAAQSALEITRKVAKIQLPPDTFLSVNFPAAVETNCKQMITELGARGFNNTFEKKVDAAGRTMYFHAGEELETLESEYTDIEAIRRNHVSITPLRYHFTNHEAIDSLRSAFGDLTSRSHSVTSIK